MRVHQDWWIGLELGRDVDVEHDAIGVGAEVLCDPDDVTDSTEDGR